MPNLILYIILNLSPAFAQTPEVDVGTARIEPTQPVSIVTSKQIENSTSTSVEDVLRAVPGLILSRSGGYGQSSFVFIRGGDSGGTLVLLDGVPMNDPSLPNKAFDFSILNLDDVERIEVWKGPQSVLFGSGATGGAINIISRREEKTNVQSLDALGGSYGTYRAVARASGTAGSLTYSASATRTQSAGFSAASDRYNSTEPDASWTDAASVRLGWRAGTATEFDLTARVLDQAADLDFAPSNVSPFTEADAPNYTGQTKSSSLAASASHSWTHALDSKIVFARQGEDRTYRNDPDSVNPSWLRAHYTGENYRVENVNHWRPYAGLDLSFTPLYESESAGSEYQSDSFNSFAPRSTTELLGAAIRAQFDQPNYFITAGAREDHHSEFGTETAYEIDPGLHLGSATDLAFRWATAYKAPTLAELYDPKMGNPNLRPEYVRGMEVSLAHRLSDSGSKIQIAGFENNHENLIQFAQNRYFNVDSARDRGIEVETVYATDLFSFHAGYTYLETRDNSTGQSLIRRPRNILSARIESQFTAKWSGVLDYDSVDHRLDLDPVTNQSVIDASYQIFSARVDYQATQKLKLYAIANNILDLKYEEVAGYATARRSGYAGATYSF